MAHGKGLAACLAEMDCSPEAREQCYTLVVMDLPFVDLCTSSCAPSATVGASIEGAVGGLDFVLQGKVPGRFGVKKRRVGP